MPTQSQEFVADACRQAAETFNRTLQIGVELQEQNVRFWTDLLSEGAAQARARWEKAAADAAPFHRRNVERFQRLVDEQSKQSLSLLRKSIEAGQVRNPADACEKLSSVWREAFDAIRDSADAVAKANAELFQSWSELMKTGVDGGSNGHARATPSSSRRGGRK